MEYLRTYSFQHMLSVAIAVIIAIIANHFFSFSREGWIVLAAFFMGQTTRGTPLRQSFIFFVSLNFAILVANVFLEYIETPLYMNFLLALIFIFTGSITFFKRYLTNESSAIILFFAMTLFIAILMPNQTTSGLQMRVMDIMMGSVIGIFCSQWVFPRRLDKEFSRCVVPILDALLDYSNGLIINLHNETSLLASLADKKIHIEKVLYTAQEGYPNWVYEVGFNPGLRAGFRFFLINLERIVEIVFSVNYWVMRTRELDIRDLNESIAIAMQKNIELLDVLREYFADGLRKSSPADFTGDITDLEKNLSRVVPVNLELLDMSIDYVTLTALVRDIKDMRQVLLDLVIALPD